MAPGSAGEWPRVIPKPGSPLGRLVKVEGMEAILELAAVALENDGRCPIAARIRAILDGGCCGRAERVCASSPQGA